MDVQAASGVALLWLGFEMIQIGVRRGMAQMRTPVRSTIRRMDPSGLVIAAMPQVKIPVKLVGVDYEVTPPKAYLALALAMRAKAAGEDPTKMSEMLEAWILKAFGKVNAAKIQKRLEDEADDLDITHIMQLMSAVMEHVTGDPTT